jgi:hypothetical protein
MSIARTFGTLTLGAMGLINAADATAQETKTPAKSEQAKVVKFITNEDEATLVSKSTTGELAGRVRVEAATAKPIEFTQEELKERAQLIEKFSHLLPTEKIERESFDKRISTISNDALGTLLRASKFLIENNLLTPDQRMSYFRAESLNNSAKALGAAANAKVKNQASDERTKAFLADSLNKIPMIEVSFTEDLNSTKFASRQIP